MDRFKSGDLNILISTTVIEVGVNVPSATIMVIEDADRFGLAQLHQLRGRVGRGNKQAYCFLVSGQDGPSERLKILKESNDGFEIAEKDLQMRGAGELIGIRQHGKDGLRVSDLVRDVKILMETQALLNDDALKVRYPGDFSRIDRLTREKFMNKEVEIVLN